MATAPLEEPDSDTRDISLLATYGAIWPGLCIGMYKCTCNNIQMKAEANTKNLT